MARGERLGLPFAFFLGGGMVLSFRLWVERAFFVCL